MLFALVSASFYGLNIVYARMAAFAGASGSAIVVYRVLLMLILVGVVAAVIPWNVPLFEAIIKIAPAMIAGCTVVLKPAPETPLSAYRLGEILAAAARTATFFLDRLPPELIPPWDFDASADAPTDSSAVAIVASALLDLGGEWRAPALELLGALVGSCLNRGDADGLLLHGCYRHNVGEGIDCATVWGDFFLLDRGSDHGITKGAQFVLYRNKNQAQNFLYDLGEAIAVEVTPQSSTLQITVSRDAIQSGDLVALRK